MPLSLPAEWNLPSHSRGDFWTLSGEDLYLHVAHSSHFTLTTCAPHWPCRDGGLKRQKVKDSYKEEQQKMYSSIIVGQNGYSPSKACDFSTEDTGRTGSDSWWPFGLAMFKLVDPCWCYWMLHWLFQILLVLCFIFFVKLLGRERKNRSVCLFACVGMPFDQQEAVYDSAIFLS